jgi:hypothetical protein
MRREPQAGATHPVSLHEWQPGWRGAGNFEDASRSTGLVGCSDAETSRRRDRERYRGDGAARRSVRMLPLNLSSGNTRVKEPGNHW